MWWPIDEPGAGLGESVDASVPIIRAAARVYVELLAAADAIELPLVEAVAHFEDRMDIPVLEEQVTDEQAAKVRRVCDAARIAQRRYERDRAENRHAPFRRHPEHDQQDRLIGEIHREGEQQPED